MLTDSNTLLKLVHEFVSQPHKKYKWLKNFDKDHIAAICCSPSVSVIHFLLLKVLQH